MLHGISNRITSTRNANKQEEKILKLIRPEIIALYFIKNKINLISSFSKN